LSKDRASHSACAIPALIFAQRLRWDQTFALRSAGIILEQVSVTSISWDHSRAGLCHGNDLQPDATDGRGSRSNSLSARLIRPDTCPSLRNRSAAAMLRKVCHPSNHRIQRCKPPQRSSAHAVGSRHVARQPVRWAQRGTRVNSPAQPLAEASRPAEAGCQRYLGRAR